MAALRASRLVCEASSSIRFRISEISSERSPSPLIFLAMICTSPRMRCMPARLSCTARSPLRAASSVWPAAAAEACGLGRHVAGGAAHGLDGLAHAGALPRLGLGAAGHLIGGADHLAGAARHAERGVADVAQQARDLLHHHVDGVDDAAQHVGRDLAAPGEVALGDLHGGVEEALDVVLQLLALALFLVALGLGHDLRAQAHDGVVEGVGQQADLVAGLHLDRLAEVTAAHALGHPDDVRDRTGEAAREERAGQLPPPGRCRRTPRTGTSPSGRRRRR